MYFDVLWVCFFGGGKYLSYLPFCFLFKASWPAPTDQETSRMPKSLFQWEPFLLLPPHLLSVSFKHKSVHAMVLVLQKLYVRGLTMTFETVTSALAL